MLPPDENDLTIHDECDWNDDDASAPYSDKPQKWMRAEDYLAQSYEDGKTLDDVFADALDAWQATRGEEGE